MQNREKPSRFLPVLPFCTDLIIILYLKNATTIFSHGGAVVVVTVDDFVRNRFDVRNR